MSWALDNLDEIWTQLVQHLGLALLPVVLGLVISIPLGWLATRWRWVRAILIPVTGALYTIPSLALFTVLPLVMGTQITDPLNVIVALTIYTIALLVRSVADALSAVSENVIAAATAIGYRRFGRFVGVELPLSVPVLVAGLRVAAVSNMSLVSVGALIGVGGLGQLMTEGFQRNNAAEVLTAIVVILVLALVIDGLLVLGGRLASPWSRVGAGATA